MFKKQEEQAVINNESETIVGNSVKLRGTLKSDGNIKVEGKLSGEIKTKGDVFIAQTAEVDAKISAKNVTISGSVNGNVDVTEQVEITESGQIFGDISAHVLSIKPGAIFSGKCTMEVKSLEEVEPKIEPKMEYETDIKAKK